MVDGKDFNQVDARAIDDAIVAHENLSHVLAIQFRYNGARKWRTRQPFRRCNEPCNKRFGSEWSIASDECLDRVQVTSLSGVQTIFAIGRTISQKLAPHFLVRDYVASVSLGQAPFDLAQQVKLVNRLLDRCIVRESVEKTNYLCLGCHRHEAS
jgi:hypothetical protein